MANLTLKANCGCGFQCPPSLDQAVQIQHMTREAWQAMHQPERVLAEAARHSNLKGHNVELRGECRVDEVHSEVLPAVRPHARPSVKEIEAFIRGEGGE